MSKMQDRGRRVRFLALCHRYGIIVLVVAALAVCMKLRCNYLLLILGVGFLLLAAWDTAGYFLRWRHVYCSWQNAKKRKMTPNDIRWGTVDKKEYFLCVILNVVVGIAEIVVQLVWG